MPNYLNKKEKTIMKKINKLFLKVRKKEKSKI